MTVDGQSDHERTMIFDTAHTHTHSCTQTSTRIELPLFRVLCLQRDDWMILGLYLTSNDLSTDSR